MAEGLQITVAWSPVPRCVFELALALPALSRAADALALAAQQDARFAALPAGYSLSICNQRAQRDQMLNDGDRIEICRPLRVDPKAARRERFKKQGAKSSGLFALRRPGAKAGY